MAQALTSTYDSYLASFRAFSEQTGADPEWLRDLRRRALDRFAAAGMPVARRGNERWKYTDVRPIAAARLRLPSLALEAGVPSGSALQQALPWDKAWATLVFVDGRYAPAHSSQNQSGAIVMNLADAVHSQGDVLQQHLGRYADIDEDGFIALNTAFLRDGAYVRVPDGYSAPQVVHIVHVATEPASVSHPRTLIVCGRESRISIVESYTGQGVDTYLNNAVTETFLDEGAQLEHYQLTLQSPNAYHVAVSRVFQSQASTVRSLAYSRGTGIGRNDTLTTLAGAGSSCYLDGLYLTRGEEHIDNYINIDHAAPHSTSRLFYKGILDGKSQAIFGGMVMVRPGAVKADSEQTDKNLLLSPEAEVNSKPSLEIYADDVRCSHGATAGAVAEDAIFYMLSRGLDREAAMTFLIQGFASEIVERAQNKAVHSFLEGQLRASLGLRGQE